MLGIDLGENQIRVISLSHRAAGTFLRPGRIHLRLDSQDQADPRQWARPLRQALKDHRWQGRKAVITLPDRMGYVRYCPCGSSNGLPLPRPQHQHLTRASVDQILQRIHQNISIPQDQVVVDFFLRPGPLGPGPQQPDASAAASEPECMAVFAVAQKSAVDFCKTVAVEAGVKIHAIELHSLSAVNSLSLDPNFTPEDHANVTALFLRETHSVVAFFDPWGLFSLQTINNPFSDSHRQVPLDQWQKNMPHFLRAIELSGTNPSFGKMILASSCHSCDEVTLLARSLQQAAGGIPVWPCPPGSGVVRPPAKQKTSDEDLRDFQPALGAALEGLNEELPHFNFLHPRAKGPHKKPHLSWRSFVIAAAAFVLACSVFWLMMAQTRLAQKETLHTALDQLQPSLEKMRKARQNWNLFQAFLPPDQAGRRLSHLQIFYEISSLMPQTDQAYMTELTIVTNPRTSIKSNYNIMITGRVSQREILTRFIERLNESKRFQEAKQTGSQPREVGDVLYPVSFSITGNLSSPEAQTQQP